MSGRFITFEGGEGTGKSTQARLLVDHLRASGRCVVATREPGGSPFAERVRALILDPSVPPHAPLSEALLFYAARSDHLASVIRPALDAGSWVVCDRFSDSTRVYQGLVGGLPAATIDTLERLVVGNTDPDVTILLDVDPETGLTRAHARRLASNPSGAAPPGLDSYEARDLAFHARLRDGFLALARCAPQRIVVIDAGLAIADIAEQVRGAVESRLGAA
jgi:dTMP kinase